MKSPAFQWYAADYLADEKVMCMTLEEEGAYIRLLSICWREGSIPSEESRLSVLCKGASTTVVRVVAKCFQPMTNQPDRMVHKRLQEEVEKQAEWRRKSSEGGRKSAQKRAKSSEVKPRMVEPKCNQESKGGNTLQSSSSVFSLQIDTPKSPDEHSAYRLRLGRMFNRRESTEWSDKEKKGFKAIKVDREEFPEELEIMERFHALPKAQEGPLSWRRRDLETLLSKWSTDLDRARAWFEQAPQHYPGSGI